MRKVGESCDQVPWNLSKCPVEYGIQALLRVVTLCYSRCQIIRSWFKQQERNISKSQT